MSLVGKLCHMSKVRDFMDLDDTQFSNLHLQQICQDNERLTDTESCFSSLLGAASSLCFSCPL